MCSYSLRSGTGDAVPDRGAESSGHRGECQDRFCLPIIAQMLRSGPTAIMARALITTIIECGEPGGLFPACLRPAEYLEP